MNDNNNRHKIELLIDKYEAVFSNKSTYPCLIVLNKQPQKDFHYTEVHNLRGWIAKQQEASSINTKSFDALRTDT